MIDPQGRIAEQCMEAGRFLLNEWDWFGGIDDLTAMAYCLDAFAEALGENRRTIAICCFLDCALSRCWSLEDGGGSEIVEEALQIMKCLLTFIAHDRLP